MPQSDERNNFVEERIKAVIERFQKETKELDFREAPELKALYAVFELALSLRTKDSDIFMMLEKTVEFAYRFGARKGVQIATLALVEERAIFEARHVASKVPPSKLN